MSKVELPADMHCGSCEHRIQRALRALDGVQSVATDLKRQRVEVEFDDQRVDESEVRAAVAAGGTQGALGG